MSIKSSELSYLAQLINSSINAICLHHNLLDNSDKIMLLEASRRLQKVYDLNHDLYPALIISEYPCPAINYGFSKQERQDG